MRAVVYDTYGPPEVLRLEDVERPVPNADEILVRNHASTVNRTDCGWRSASPFITRYFVGWRRPRRKILGMEFAGVVEAVGDAVTEFAVGDRVFGVKGFGAHAEYVCVRESAAVAHMPDGVSFAEAAVSDGFCIAISCLRRARLERGQRILVYGASGSIGSATVQLARHMGANVTAVCNTKNVDLIRSLGAPVVYDYLKEDFRKNGETYDVVFDAVGKQTFMQCRKSIKPGGIFMATDGFRNLPLMLWTSRIGSRRAALGFATYKKADVLLLKQMLESGEYRGVIDRSYPLEDIVEATRYVETLEKTGNVILTLDGGVA
jgi:NADPH:quinone reductase-like Zn-dependent oxidoreductase